MKIRTQLLVFILGVVLAGFCAIIILSYSVSKSTVVSEIYERAESVRLRYQELLDGYFRSAGKVAFGMAQSVKSNKDITETEIHELLKENLKWNPEIYGMTIFIDPKPGDVGKKLFAPYYFRQGQLMKYTPANPSFKFSEQEWYSEPKKQGMPVWTEPYFDEGAGAIMTTYSAPIYRDNKFIGLATVDLGLGELSKKINSIQIGKSGYAMLVSKKGAYLTHPEPESNVLKKKMLDTAVESDNSGYKDLADSMAKGKTGAWFLTDPSTGKNSWITHGSIPSTGYSLAIFIPEEELMTSVNMLGRSILIVSLVVATLIVASIVGISWRITRPIKVLSRQAQKIADGDLDGEIEGLKSKNEVGDLSRNLEKMVLGMKKMMDEVRGEKDKFEKVFATMSEGIVVTDTNWHVVSLNNRAERMLEVSEGVNLIRHITENYKSSFDIAEFLDQRKGQKRFDMVRPESAGAKEVYFTAVINAIYGHAGEVVSYVAVVRDVTDERREDLNKSNLLSLISHKLKTPVMSCVDTIDLFKDGILGELTDKQRSCVEKMASQTAKLQKLLDRLINYVELSAERKSSPAKVDVAAIIKDVAEKKEWKRDGKTPVIEVKVSGAIDNCRIGEKQVSLIIAELVENAAKFNKSEPALIAIGAKAEGDKLVITVGDNGIGIPPIYHNKIFERFFQVDKDFTGNVEGAGLGLSIVKEFVDSYGGEILVSSKEGEGSTFTVILPRG